MFPHRKPDPQRLFLRNDLWWTLRYPGSCCFTTGGTFARVWLKHWAEVSSKIPARTDSRGWSCLPSCLSFVCLTSIRSFLQASDAKHSDSFPVRSCTSPSCKLCHARNLEKNFPRSNSLHTNFGSTRVGNRATATTASSHQRDKMLYYIRDTPNSGICHGSKLEELLAGYIPELIDVS